MIFLLKLKRRTKVILSRSYIIFKKNPILSSIVIVGFLLRIIGTSPGYYMHGYEVMYGDAVTMLLDKTIGLSYNNLAYPPLVAWIMAVGFLFIFIPLSWVWYILTHFPHVLDLITDSVDGNINLWIQIDKIFNTEILGTRYWQNAMYWGRYITAFFGTASIIIVYKIVTVYFGSKKTALLAALMFAVNYRLVINSHMGFHDIYNVFFILLALYLLGRLVKQPTRKNYLLSALWVSIGFLVKYQPSGFVAFGITHILISVKKSKANRKLFLKNFFCKNAVIAGFISIAILLVAHTNYLMRLEEVLRYSPWVWYANEFHKYKLYLFPFSYVYHTGLGIGLTLISIAGISIGIFKKSYRESTLLLSIPIFLSFYLFGFFSTGGYYTYNLLVPISFMLIFAALFLEEVRNWFFKSFNRKIYVSVITFLYVIFMLLILKDQIYNSILSTYILSKPSYRIVAEDWLNKNLKGPAKLATYSSNPRSQRDDIEVVDLPQLPHVFGYREFLEEKYDYALIDFFKIQEKNFWWMLSPPRMPTQFWEKPDDLLSQNYLALATRELLWSHTIKDFMLPWQASGYNYALTKIAPPQNFGETVPIAKFNFEQEDDWIALVFLDMDKDKLVWDSEGKSGKGSVSIKKGKEPGDTRRWATIPGGVRWESTALQAKPDFGYKVSGWIKNSEYAKIESRSGFLRLDFYQEIGKTSISSRPIITFVSARPYKDTGWHKVEIQGIAPEDANFLKLGFQADDSTVTVYLDDVEILETKNKLPKLNIRHFVIPDEDFFRPSDSSFT